jgi:hypothetical protein
MTADPFWSDSFHCIALRVGAIAHAEDWLHDSERVKREVYRLYEEELKEKNAKNQPTAKGIAP